MIAAECKCGRMYRIVTTTICPYCRTLNCHYKIRSLVDIGSEYIEFTVKWIGPAIKILYEEWLRLTRIHCGSHPELTFLGYYLSIF